MKQNQKDTVDDRQDSLFVMDRNGDVFDIATLLKRQRAPLPAEKSVRPELLKALWAVRRKMGIKYSDLAAKSGLSENFCSNALNNTQRVSHEEFLKLKGALADIVFQTIIDA